jgi:putative SOS response-associated peptidase YedK
MCGRTGQAIPPEDINNRWGVQVPEEYEPRYNVAPRDDLAVISSDTTETLQLREWGLLPQWVDDPSDWHYPINARSETVDEKPSFRDAFEKRPCLVLSSGYYEWRDYAGTKQPYRICREDREPFAMAGIWDRWEQNGSERATVAVLTCEPNTVVEPIHDRMPVILDPAVEGDWLSGTPDDRRTLLGPSDGTDLEAYPISKMVNDPSCDRSGIIKPIESEQTGLDEFVSE